MTRRLSSPSLRLAVGVGTSDPSHVTSPEEPTQRQTYSPISNRYLRRNFPLYYPLVPNPATVPEFPSLSDPPGVSPPFPSNSASRWQEPVIRHTTPVMHSVDPLYNITHGYQPPLDQLHEATAEAPFAPNPFELPYSSTAQPPPAAFPEAMDSLLSPVSLPEQIQVQPRFLPPSTPVAFHVLGGSSIADAAPHAPAIVANPTEDYLRTLYPCRCPKEDGSPCNAQVRGNKQSVREHLKDAHGFNGGGRDTVTCPWAACRTKPMRRENLPRHIVSCHLHVKSYCVHCGAELSRPDVQHSHKRSCTARRSRIGSKLKASGSRTR